MARQGSLWNLESMILIDISKRDTLALADCAKLGTHEVTCANGAARFQSASNCNRV